MAFKWVSSLDGSEGDAVSWAWPCHAGQRPRLGEPIGFLMPLTLQVKPISPFFPQSVCCGCSAVSQSTAQVRGVSASLAKRLGDPCTWGSRARGHTEHPAHPGPCTTGAARAIISSLHHFMETGAGNGLGREGPFLREHAALSNVNNHRTMRLFKTQISKAHLQLLIHPLISTKCAS